MMPADCPMKMRRDEAIETLHTSPIWENWVGPMKMRRDEAIETTKDIPIEAMPAAL